MGFLNHKILAIATLLISLYALYLLIVSPPDSQTGIIPLEIFLHALLGIVLVVLLFLKHQRALLLGRIWSLMQVPIYVSGTITGTDPVVASTTQTVTSAIHFYSLHFGFTQLKSIPQILGNPGGFTLLGVNYVGIILFVLFLLVKQTRK